MLVDFQPALKGKLVELRPLCAEDFDGNDRESILYEITAATFRRPIGTDE